MYNKVLLIGHLCADPEIRHFDGNACTTFRIATNEVWKDKQGEKQERATYHRVVCWGKLAEIVAEYARTGSLVHVEGVYHSREYTDNNSGEQRRSYEITAKDVRFLKHKQPHDGQQAYNQRSLPPQQSYGQQAVADPRGFTKEDFEGGIPF